MDRARLIVLAASGVALVIGMAVVDTLVDGDGFEMADFALELLDRGIVVGAMIAVAWVTYALREVRAENVALRRDLARAIAQGAGWREANGETLDDLADAVRRQFAAWSLTPAETDIAGLMLKGASLRDIAQARRTSETTIRQQAQGIYRKSGLAGRTELAAYFLESLFEERSGGARGAQM